MPKKRKSKTARRTRGTGSVYFDTRRGEWVFKVQVGRYQNGRPKYREVRGDTQAEVVERAKEVKPATATATVAEWAKRWLDSLDLRPQTIDCYRESVRLRVVPQLGARPLAALTVFEVEEAMRVWGKSVAAGTVRRTVACLSSCLQAACRAELVTRNVARLATRPAATAPKFDLFTPDEMERIVAAGQTKPNWRPFALCAATGCRIGEALALHPDDYDAATGKLHIHRTKTRRHTIGPAKSKASNRVIEVPPDARPILEAGVPNGHYPNAHVRWTALLKSLGVRYRGMHQMKHTVASQLVAAGMPIADAAAFLGDSFEVFVKTYCHPVGADVAGAIQGMLSGAKAARLTAQAAQNSAAK